jgi:hypothetical protein
MLLLVLLKTIRIKVVHMLSSKDINILSISPMSLNRPVNSPFNYTQYFKWFKYNINSFFSHYYGNLHFGNF